jgi:HEAT repeat protein
VNALIHVLENDPVTYVKESAIQALVRLNLKDEKILKAISAMMTSSVDDEVKMIAAESLETLQASNKDVIDIFLYTLKSSKVVDLRMRAAAALAR